MFFLHWPEIIYISEEVDEVLRSFKNINTTLWNISTTSKCFDKRLLLYVKVTNLLNLPKTWLI